MKIENKLASRIPASLAACPFAAAARAPHIESVPRYARDSARQQARR